MTRRSIPFPLARFRVEDRSLAPALRPGDYVIVNRLAYRRRPPAPGDLVVLRHPTEERHLVKRVAAVTPDGACLVEGDHPRSEDSRRFGPVPPDRIVGKVWWHVRR